MLNKMMTMEVKMGKLSQTSMTLSRELFVFIELTKKLALWRASKKPNLSKITRAKA